MINGVSPRLFGTFREGALVHVQFIFTTAGASPVIVYKAPNATGGTVNQVQPAAAAAKPGQLLLARAGGAGLYTLTLVGGCRRMTAHCKVLNKNGAAATALRVETITQVESTGVFNLQLLNSAGAAADLATANDELHVTLYVDK